MLLGTGLAWVQHLRYASVEKFGLVALGGKRGQVKGAWDTGLSNLGSQGGCVRVGECGIVRGVAEDWLGW